MRRKATRNFFQAKKPPNISGAENIARVGLALSKSRMVRGNCSFSPPIGSVRCVFDLNVVTYLQNPT